MTEARTQPADLRAVESRARRDAQVESLRRWLSLLLGALVGSLVGMGVVLAVLGGSRGSEQRIRALEQEIDGLREEVRTLHQELDDRLLFHGKEQLRQQDQIKELQSQIPALPDTDREHSPQGARTNGPRATGQDSPHAASAPAPSNP